MFTLPQLIARLTRGYIKFTGKQPDNLAKIKIQQEALQKFKDSNKVKSLQDFKDKKGIKSLPVNEQFTTKPNVEPIIKSLDDDVATAQINKLKQDFDFSDRNKVLQLLDDIDAKKAFGAFDDIQRKELRSMISDMYTRKPEFASGGIAGQLHLNEGGRVPMIFGGSLGLKALIKRMKGLNKRLFPGKIGVDKRKLAKTLMPREFEQLQRLKIEQLENLLEALKLDKQQMAMRAQNKAMRDPGLDFMMKKLDEMPESGLTSEADLAKYVDIDKDILNLEQMIKNKTMKDRKPNAKGGLANILGV